MKIVMTYGIGDGWTWNAEVTNPIEYESVEKAEYDFLELCEKACKDYENRKFEPGVGWTANGYFKFCGEEYSFNDFCDIEEILTTKGEVRERKMHYKGPLFRTLDEWFEQEKKLNYD